MTVKELEAVLATMKNKDMPVLMSGYYDVEVNGYYIDEKGGVEALILTRLDVMPRKTLEA